MLPHEMLQTQTQVERSLLSRVMGWLALSLALTTGGIYLWIAGVVPQNIPWLLYFIVAIGLIFGIQAATNSKNQSLAVGLFGLFSVIEGLFIAPIVPITCMRRLMRSAAPCSAPSASSSLRPRSST
jgi:FtsH-binding integral membrane protein